MLEVARYEGERRLVVAGAITAAACFYGAMFVALTPSFTNVDLDAILESYPDQLVVGFGIESLNSLAGLLSVELYQFGWVLVLGLYLAYTTASLVAGGIESGRLDTLLAAPVSRARVVAETFASILVPILAVNAVTPVVIYVGGRLIDDPVNTQNLIALHILAVPYLLCCAAVGLAFSVFLPNERLAQRGAVGVLVMAFLVRTLLTGTDYAVVERLTPMHYFDPSAILLDGVYDLGGAAVLLVVTTVLVVASQLRFRRMDIT
ncbi:ABC transporter permease subunit [Halococcus hamelinensis]|uniref:ABC transporter permease n=1 Tax=Halococcus hamelinensis 100A6 TaxID=1132509 RepID=M0M1D6_9EURY|nr:ABC transporter permease subunit [Halococcus hamelinensis]EMA39622.1 hypothetical protein C447_06581 [Halococcus hamelinensis 100A6]